MDRNESLNTYATVDPIAVVSAAARVGVFALAVRVVVVRARIVLVQQIEQVLTVRLQIFHPRLIGFDVQCHRAIGANNFN